MARGAKPPLGSRDKAPGGRTNNSRIGKAAELTWNNPTIKARNTSIYVDKAKCSFKF